MTYTDANWAKLTPRERDAKVAEGVWGHSPFPAIVGLASTWAGAGLVIAEMTKPNRAYSLSLTVGGIRSTAIWHRLGEVRYASIQGPPDKTAPSAIALAALRAIQGANNEAE